MSHRLAQLATAADGRYFTADERQAFLDYAESLSQRFRAAEAVEQNEEAILRSVIGEMQKKYPNFVKYHDQAWARQYRDTQLVLRAGVQAMIFDDPARLDDHLLYWMRTMFSANNYTPQFVRDCFELLRDKAREQLGGDEFALVEPLLNRNIQVLTDFPEPSAAAV